METFKKFLLFILLFLILCPLFTSCGHRGADISSGSSHIGDTSSEEIVGSSSGSPLLSCEVTGPGSSSPYGEAYNADTDDPYMLHGYSVLKLTESGEGFYFVEVYPNGLYLYYMPKDTMQPVPLCNKPNCLHGEREDDPHATLQEIKAKRMECNAYVDSLKSLSYYKGSLYCVGNFDALSQDLALYKISSDGSQKEKVYSFHFEENYDENGNLISSTPVAVIVGDVTLHRGYLYYIVQTPEQAVLYRLPFELENKEPEALYTYQSTDGFIRREFYDHYLYIGDHDQNQKKIYTRIDLETGERIENINIIGSLSFYEGKAFMNDPQSGIFFSDLECNDINRIPEPCTNVRADVVGPYILGYDLSEEEIKNNLYNFTLYNGKGEIQGTFSVSSEGEPHIEGASGNILFLSLVTNGNREHYYLDFSTQTLSLFFSDTN